ncbi:MAG TPA: type II toxin-antitoxin system RelE/ParE family toxin [Terracidiphilus sp.]|nr:type II toxin-antitoxin system RelE/ParE family toxin [Terracidiphilus sp.]
MARKPIRVFVYAAARNDILRQHAFYLDERGAAHMAEKFLDAVQAAMEKLRRMPDAGAPKKLKHPLLAGLRAWPVEGFPAMRIYYLYRAGEVLVVRVLDGRRDLDALWEEPDFA